MEVPLGQRIGALALWQQGQCLTGTLTMFGCTRPVTGALDAQGVCRLSGQLQTRFHCHAFQAEGTLTGQGLALTLRGEFGVYTMTGILKSNQQEADDK